MGRLVRPTIPNFDGFGRPVSGNRDAGYLLDLCYNQRRKVYGMAVRTVVLYPDDPLTQRAEPVIDFGPELAAFVEDLFDTMVAYEGVGLAAPQVGVSKRIFVMHPPEGERLCLVNPEIVEAEGRAEAEEGCLSLPRIYAVVPRATRIRVRAYTVEGQPLDFVATDYPARIIQHEYDHLEGILFPDRLDILTRESVLREWEKVRAELAAVSAQRR